MKFVSLIFGILISIQAKSESALIFGDQFKFSIHIPNGWECLCDGKEAAKIGANAILHPKGKEWQKANAFIFLRVNSAQDDNVKEDVAADIMTYKKEYPDASVEKIDIEALKGYKKSSILFARINKSYEYVTYIAPEPFHGKNISVAMNVKSVKASDEVLDAYQEVTKSVQWLDNKKAIHCPDGGEYTNSEDTPKIIATTSSGFKLIVCAYKDKRTEKTERDAPYEIYFIQKNGTYSQPIFNSGEIGFYNITKDSSGLTIEETYKYDSQEIKLFQQSITCTRETCSLQPKKCILDSTKINPDKARKVIQRFKKINSDNTEEIEKYINSQGLLAYWGDKTAQQYFFNDVSTGLDGFLGESYSNYLSDLKELKKAGCLKVR
ncbi:hypothetical protein [Bdellovibrio sp. NC01]|uniref:hypothetical protein n=1 Tax=Bdellovibrio sp. NC01 TaxID=2220073 RepID=UPI001157B732|nr:hypothetical protein [Bdellovibrio sp. NC01]QDK37974.1 hypothetical protein DOE51_10425 [Bdellovibrio sp. NC01]